MPGDSEHPVTLGDLRVLLPTEIRVEDLNQQRPATVADLMSALRAEGAIVVGPKVDGRWPAWARLAADRLDWVAEVTLNALAEAQPFPPAGG